MDFAKSVLEKYGWKDGDGLGKEKQGIRKPIKANLKFDQAGLGSDPSKEFNNNWWDRCFNDAAQNIKVKKRRNGDINVKLQDTGNSVEVTTKTYSVKKLKESGSMYGKNFLTENAFDSSFVISETRQLTDEELFRACGGRTGHKGARHGLKLSGKLARLEQQEKELLAKMQVQADSLKETSSGEENNRLEELNKTKDANKRKKEEKHSKRDTESVLVDDIINIVNEKCKSENEKETDETRLITKSHKKKKHKIHKNKRKSKIKCKN